MSKKNRNEREKTYDVRIQPRSVHALNDGVVKIIKVTLTLVLQLMEEVEDVKSERGRRTFNRCWKPTGAEELNVFGRVVTTMTVADNEAVGTRQVENHEVVKRRGVGARVTDVVPELNDKANGGEGTLFEVAAIPPLRCVSDGRLWQMSTDVPGRCGEGRSSGAKASTACTLLLPRSRSDNDTLGRIYTQSRFFLGMGGLQGA